MKRNLSIATNNTESTETSVDETIIPVEMKKVFVMRERMENLLQTLLAIDFHLPRKVVKHEREMFSEIVCS